MCLRRFCRPLVILFLVLIALQAGGSASAQRSRPVPIPLVIDEWEDPRSSPEDDDGPPPIPMERHERDRFDWQPGFELNIPTFDSENRPYVRTLGEPGVGLPDLQVLGTDGRWHGRGFEDGGALTALVREARGACGYQFRNEAGDVSTKVVFDQHEDAYFVVEIALKRRAGGVCDTTSERQLVLLHSRDGARSWTPYLLPVHGEFAYEHPWSPENLEGPPAIVVHEFVEKLERYPNQDDSLGKWGTLSLIKPTRTADGTLEIGSAATVSRRASSFSSRSGAPSIVATWNDRTYVTWGEIPEDDGGDRPAGVPTYINVFDPQQGGLVYSEPPLLAYAPPVDDGHNVPGMVIDSRGHLHVITGAHAGHFKYLRSLQPERIDGWTRPQPTTTESSGKEDCMGNVAGWRGGCQTYLSFMRDSKDTLHIAYRQYQRDGIDPSLPWWTWGWQSESLRLGGVYYGALVHQRKTAAGEWEPPTTLVVPSIPKYYVYYHKMSIDKNDRLYLLYHHWSKHEPYCQRDRATDECTAPARGIGALLVTDDANSWRLVGTNEMAAAIGWEPLSTHLGDTDGDGRAEVVSTTHRGHLTILRESVDPDGPGPIEVSTIPDTPVADTYPPLMGDVDGDGLEDLVSLSRDVDGWLHVATRQTDGFGEWTELGRDVLGDGPGVHQYPTLMGDVDGDGLDDLIFVFRHWKDGWLTIRTKRSNGDGTWTDLPQQKLGDGPGVHQYPTLVGDVTGDGRDDLVFVFRHWKNGMLTTRTKAAAGDGTWHDWGQDQMTDGPGVHEYPTLLGDVTGDGHADLVFVFRDWQTGELALRTKEAIVDAVGSGLEWADLGHVTLPDGPGIHQYPTQIGDVTGDGLEDLVFVFRHWADGERAIRVKRSLGDGRFRE